jgi:ATP-dependent protease HslVU (ClpYQ) peptidase subunit
MKLDLNNDGRVTVGDLIMAIQKIKKMVVHSELLVKAIELPHEVRKRAISYFEHDVRSNQGELERKLVKSDENNSSTDSIELQKLVEKDD